MAVLRSFSLLRLVSEVISHICLACVRAQTLSPGFFFFFRVAFVCSLLPIDMRWQDSCCCCFLAAVIHMGSGKGRWEVGVGGG